MTPRRARFPVAQLRLSLDRPPSDRREDFVVSPVNAAAVAAVDAWRTWPDGRLALIGPEGSGKSHLARAWARETGARIYEPGAADLAALHGQPILVEDADRRPADAGLFHLLNLADLGARILITARLKPRLWPTDVPDLRSRLNGLVTAELSAPDDIVLEGVIRKLFRERNIKPDGDVPGFLARRIERAVPAAVRVVEAIDEAAAASRREVNRVLAREVLEELDQPGDLFE